MIEDIAFAVVLSDGSLNRDDLAAKSRNRDFGIRIGPNFSFVAKSGPITMNVASDEEGISNARFGFVRKDVHSDAYNFLKTPGTDNFAAAGQGLSPFSNWSFNTDPLKNLVKAQPALFYKNPSRGILLLPTDGGDASATVVHESFRNDFEDFEAQPKAETGFSPVEVFPERVSEIPILVRFSSLTAGFQNQLQWIEACR